MKNQLREATLGYLFWTLFQALAPMIWFYPLNELEISGYEAFAVMLFSPIFVGIPFVRTSLKHRWTMALLRVVSLACVASFQMQTTLRRLIVLSIGCFTIMLVLTATITSGSIKQRSQSLMELIVGLLPSYSLQVTVVVGSLAVSLGSDEVIKGASEVSQSLWGLSVGLLAFIASRIWFTSFVPAWWNQTTNSIVIALIAIATIDKIISGDDDTRLSTVSTPGVKSNWLFTGFGFGSLLYLTQAVFGEVSLVPRWVVSGYPSTGPTPYPWGAVILLALFTGIVLSWTVDLAQSVLWWIVGSLSFGALYLLPTWQGFAGGVVLAVYTGSLWPLILDKVSASPPARTLTVAALIWLIETLYSVWTVAYNFVPGGVYTREHTGWLIATVMISIGFTTLTGRMTSRSQSYSAFIELTKGQSTPDKYTRILLVMVVVSGLGGFIARYPQQTFEHPPKVQPRADFTAAIWTYHFGYDNVGWPSLERSARLLRDTGADVITLLESDASKPYLGNNDLGMWLGERLQMYVDFGPSTRDHTWGNLLLSKYPFVKSVHHLLPSPHGELAPAITATVNMSGNLVDFVVTHMGNDRDVIDRDLQAKFLAGQLAAAENPVVFLGYVTSAPFSRDYKTLTQQGKVKDIDSTDRDRWCEYIMYRGLTRLGYARVSHGGLSDTEVQIGRFRIPQEGSTVSDNTHITIDTQHVESEVLFNPVFGGYSEGHNWVQAHRYHMSTPKYFVEKSTEN